MARLALAVSLVLTGTCGSATGQDRLVQVVSVYGRVQWIAAERMVVATDCLLLDSGCLSASLSIDLRRVPLSEYRGVRPGSWVTVSGAVVHDGIHRIIATSVRLIEALEAP